MSETSTTLPVFKTDLSALPLALDADRMKAVFTPLLWRYFKRNLEINRIAIVVLRERSKRCVLRYKIHAVDSVHAREVTWSVIGKVFRPTVGEKVFVNMQQLWQNGFSRNAEDGISMPEPIDFQSSLCLLIQEEVPGSSLKVLMNPLPQKEHFRQMGRALAKLHRCAFVPDVPFTVRDHLMRCHPKHEFLAFASPELAPDIDYIVERAYRIEAAFGQFPLALLHGDFHLGQIHLADGRVWLIDFDALSYGDPAADLGNLLVFLKAKASRNPAFNGLIDAFLGEYFSIMDPGIAARIPLYEALTHVRRACKCLRLQKEEWLSKAQAMIKRGVSAINEIDQLMEDVYGKSNRI